VPEHRLTTRVKRANELSRLAAGPVSRPWLAAVVHLLPVTRRAAPDLRLPIRVAVGDQERWFWFRDESELIALEEIFLEGEYALPDGGPVGTIVDLGANVGQAALWFRTRHPRARIVSVEPDPRTFAILQRNHARDPLIELRQVAITAADGWCTLAREPNSSWGTRVVAGGGHVDHVPAVSLATLLEQHGIDEIDLLKVDIEGMEYESLATSHALRRARRVIGELHPSLIGLPVDVALEDLRRNGGFALARRVGDIFVLER
jgi:FkbM family methyltransferase